MYQYRLKILLGIVITFFCVLTGRLFYVQLVEGRKYSGISNNRRIRVRKLDATRGMIYDRNGEVLAIDRQSFNLSVKYKDLLYGYLVGSGETLPRIENMRAHKNTKRACDSCHATEGLWVESLSKLLGKPRSDLLSNAGQIISKVETIKENVEQKHNRSVRILEETLLHPVASDVDFEKVAIVEVNQKDYPGVYVETIPVRWYPHHELASHTIGYVGDRALQPEGEINNPEVAAIIQDVKQKQVEGVDDIEDINNDEYTGKYTTIDDMAGHSGIERVYDAILSGTHGERFEEVILKDLQVSKLILNKPPKTGYNVYLTLDSKIQSLAEDALGENTGAIVVMNPQTGEILALASYPRFDLNSFRDDYPALIQDQRKPFLNRPIQSALPPGSIFKIVTSIAALSEGAINFDTTFTCVGKNRSTSKRFRCHSKYGHGTIALADAIRYSCNTFFVNAGKSTGGAVLWKWANRFGFGKKTGIDLPYEQSGNLPAFRTKSETMNASLGQGSLLITPLQITIMMSAIANGGGIVKPHLIKKITDNKGKVVFEKDPAPKLRLDIPPEHQNEIKKGLRKVITEGTARMAKLDEYSVAGKTGTSETSKKDVNHAWFSGFAPLDHPEYCFTVLVERTSLHASRIAVPIAKKLVTSLLQKEAVAKSYVSQQNIN